MAKRAKNKPALKELKKEGNAYDKIFKENVEQIFRPLVEERLGVTIVKSTPLKEKMQTTVEVEMDFFYAIETDTGEKFILHIEFESGDNPIMVYRVGEYHGMALRREKLPIRHIVIYLGEAPPTMRTQLKPEEIFTGFDLLNVQALDTEQLLSSQVPEMILIAVLSNYPKEDAESILRNIILNLRKIIKHKRTLKRYINQLMMLSRLRKIEELTIKIAEDMPIHYDIETDALYLRGTKKGEIKGIEKGKIEGIEKGKEAKAYISVMNLLIDTDFDDERIARLVKVPLAFVLQVKAEKRDFMSVNSLLLDTDFDDEKISNLLNVALEFVKKIRFVVEQ